jgi:hypothetical protein
MYVSVHAGISLDHLLFYLLPPNPVSKSLFSGLISGVLIYEVGHQAKIKTSTFIT